MRTGCNAMFNGIIVNVIKMPVHIVLVMDDVFPQSLLPYPAPALTELFLHHHLKKRYGSSHSSGASK